MPSILILNMSNQQANGNISNLHCCAQTAKGNIVILLDTLCFEHAKYLSPFTKRTQPMAHTTLSSKLLSVTAKRMYAFWTINTMPPCPHAINSDSQHVQSASERKHLQSSLLCSDSQGKHCHPTGQSLFRTCKIPKSFHQANGTHITLSSKLLSVTAKRMYAFRTINTMPPYPHAINSDSQHVQSASERKHLQSSLLCSDSQGKHCHPTGHSLLRTCKVPKSLHQANTTHSPYHFIVKATLSHSQANVCILDDQYHAAMPPCHQFWFSTCPISKRTETSPIFTAVLRQPRETLSSYWTLFVSNMQST